jgi:NAD(P)-dependent dehydrogenase (short-subunit alcohol dehydrogenase family)
LKHHPKKSGNFLLAEALMSHLAGKVALVTGGSRGIGAGIAKALAKHGASVAITYTKGADAAAKVVKEIEGAGGKALAIQADSLDPAAVKASVAKTVEKFGRLDILVNNAGTAIPKPFEEATLEEIDLMFNLNVRAAMVATQAALKHMKEGGRVIMIGSCVGEKKYDAGSGGVWRNQGRGENVYAGIVAGSGAAWNYGEQCAARADRYGSESGGGGLGDAAGGEYGAQAVWDGG